MLLTLVVTFFTVRIVFNILGENDYGLYNVIGGIVFIFSFISGSLSTATQRFLTIELGKNDLLQFKKTFSLIFILYFIVAIIILFLAETLGLWFLNNKMLIPQERLIAANWVYQFSIFTFLVSILTIPYNASILSHEHMYLYAYMSIVDVFLKLFFLIVLYFFLIDKLILYSFLVLVTTCLTSFLYWYHCKKKYPYCTFQFYWNKSLFIKIFNFSSWNIFGAIATVLNNQGFNILINIFFGSIINTARALSYQIITIINQFAFNFQTTINPKIIKYYAKGDTIKMKKMILQSSKLCYFIVFLISFPLLFESHFIIELWLKKVPGYVVNFIILMIIISLIDSLSYSLMVAAQATGKIKKYQFIVGGFMLLYLPCSYSLYKYGYNPYSSMYLAILFSIVSLFLRLYMLNDIINLSFNLYFKSVLLKVIIVTFFSIIPLFIIVINFKESFLRLVLVLFLGLISYLFSLFNFGLNHFEKRIFKRYLKYKINLINYNLRLLR
jgi:O-antigen/teichoic acid export membrane protein